MQLRPTVFDPSGVVVVVGSTPDATEAVRLLRRVGANVRWCASEIDLAEEVLLTASPPGWLELSSIDPLKSPSDGAAAIVCADDGPLDDAVAARARARNVPVHVIDRPEISTIQLFAPTQRGCPWITGPIGQDWKGFRARHHGSLEHTAS